MAELPGYDPQFAIVYGLKFSKNFKSFDSLPEEEKNRHLLFKKMFFQYPFFNSKGHLLGEVLKNRFNARRYFMNYEELVLPQNDRREYKDGAQKGNFIPQFFAENESFELQDFRAKNTNECFMKSYIIKQSSSRLKELVVLSPYDDAHEMLQELISVLDFLRVSDDKSGINWNKTVEEIFKKATGKDKYPIVTNSARMALFHRLLYISSLDPSGHVLLLGESGTGKELAAEVLQKISSRGKGPFFRVNCSTLGENLAHSILFGHVKGAFTGADETKEGLIKIANKGTLFLDELQSLPPQTCNMLLRFMETKDFRKLGGDKTEHSDVKIIAACCDFDLLNSEALLKNGFLNRFRYILTNPPLRLRGDDDIKLLSEQFYDEVNAEFKDKGLVLPDKDLLPIKYFYLHEWKNQNIRGLKTATRNWYLRVLVDQNGDISQKECLKKARGIRTAFISDEAIFQLLEEHQNNGSEALFATLQKLRQESSKKKTLKEIYGNRASLYRRLVDIHDENMRKIALQIFKKKYNDYPGKKPRIKLKSFVHKKNQ